MLHVFLFSTENAAEKELRRENTDHKDSGEFLSSVDFFFSVHSTRHDEDIQFVALGTLSTQVIM